MKDHWPEYAIEAACLGLFLVSAAGFATLLQHPASPIARVLTAGRWPPALTRLPMGLAMGLTLAAIVYSPLGRRSGAHMNPAVTLTFAWLGKIPWPDVAGYLAGQFVGGAAGILAAVAVFGGLPAHPSVNYVATLPGPAGAALAFGAEGAMSFLMMTTILTMSSRPSTAPATGLAAAALVATFITVEAPLSGMSMNLARSLTTNLLASNAASLWIYATAPLAGMLCAGAGFVWRAGSPRVPCPKLHHALDVRCIFCGHAPVASAAPSPTATRTESLT